MYLEIMFKLIYYAIRLPFEIILLPFKLIGILLPSPKNIYNDNNIWNLSDEDKRIAREERMSDADYIEAEEKDDDNLDNDY